MYQVNELKLAVLIEASDKLLASLVASPVWGMIENEPIIQNWKDALQVMKDDIPKT